MEAELLRLSDALEVSEAVDLLLGMKPSTADEPDQSKLLRELAYRAIEAGALPCIGKKKDRMVAPSEFARWAAGKGFDTRSLGDKPIETESHAPATGTTPNRIIRALVLALADAHPDTLKKDGRPFIGYATDTGHCGIVGHLIDGKFTDLKTRALENAISKALKDA
jgi:hypothetical protein